MVMVTLIKAKDGLSVIISTVGCHLPQREWLTVQYYSIYKMETALCFLAMCVGTSFLCTAAAQWFKCFILFAESNFSFYSRSLRFMVASFVGVLGCDVVKAVKCFTHKLRKEER